VPTVTLPNNWRPRPYQLKAWTYLETGGRHAELIWHRRSGKDEIALHRTACAAFERTGNYWHMLPEYSQARKAIWDAVNPHTGLRRIDEAFPREIRESENGQEMKITFKGGSSWQVVGSDSYNRLVGASPIGVVFSEWALANPAARGFIRPMLLENGGWQMYITTPRGRNHAHRTLQTAKQDPKAFAQVLTADQTGIFTTEQLEGERQALIDDYGLDQGEAMFMQEYFCSFDAAVLGAYYGREFKRVDADGRIADVAYDPALKVHTAWDLGYRDDTAIWFWQQVLGEVRIIDFHASSGLDFDAYIEIIRKRGYDYGHHWMPHDARAKTLASGGKSIEEMARRAFGTSSVRIVPNLSVQDGIQAARRLLQRCWFDHKAEEGTEALRQYRREYDTDKKAFRERPVHDWTSHPADAFRMLAIAWQVGAKDEPVDTKPKFAQDMTFSDLWALDEQEWH
jgi:phage terminase large subunit